VVALGSEDGVVRLWQEGVGVQTLSPNHAQTVYAVAWSPNGQVLASGSNDGLVRLWRRTQDGAQHVADLNENRGPVFALAWGSDQLLAIGRQDNPKHEVELVNVTGV
jgi:WD40 repeat protein